MPGAFWKSDEGQDCAEYSLLLAFVAVVIASMALLFQDSIHKGITACWAKVLAHLRRVDL